MSTAARHSAQTQPASRGVLWFGLLGGAGAWLVHLMAAYAIAEFGCVSGFGSDAFLGMSRLAWILLALSVAMLLIAGASTVVAYRGEQRLRKEDRAAGDATHAGAAQLARAGWVMSGLFALVILVESLPIFYYIHHC